MFRVPSSTPPRSSTADYLRDSRNGPSTTPAGPPPDQTMNFSSTPAGPPPSRGKGLFSTSRPNFEQPSAYDFGLSAFGSSPPKHGLFEGVGSGSIGTSTTGRPPVQRGRTTSSGGFNVPDMSSDEDGEGESDEDMEDEDAEGEYEDDDMDEDEEDYDEDDDIPTQPRAKTQSRFSQSVVSRASTSDLEPGPTLVRPGAKQTQFDLLALSKGLAPNADRAVLQEPDHVILETERLAEKVHESLNSDTPERRSEVLVEVAEDLTALWKASSKTASNTNLSSSRSGGALGLAHASRLANLLLSIHHPPLIGAHKKSSAFSLVPARPESRQYTPIPKIMLDWLNTTYAGASEVDEVLKVTKGYSMHPSFWEAVHVTAVRGNFKQTLLLLQGARFEFAETAKHDGLGNTGYTMSHLQFANEAARVAVDLLRDSPAVLSEDWDIKGNDWTLFRQRVLQTYKKLEDFAEGESASRQAVSQPFQASHFGISQSQASFQLSVASRKAESKVPWSVYENLRKLYQLLLGNEEEILALSADWIEAVMGLVIWWDGEEEDLTQGTLAASRRSVMRSQRIRSVDVTPVKSYSQRMSSSLAAVIANSDEDFGVNTTDRFEVGLACILDDNIEAALQMIRSWSLTVAAAVAEVASAGGWFTRADGIMGQFDQSDLMVLSYNDEQPRGVSKDDLLIAFADVLATRGQITDQRGQREGWEVAIQVLGRLDNNMTANERIEGILNELPLESSVRVDKITQLCHNLGLAQHALTIAEKFAEHLRANTKNYGDTLLYYARAHDAQKIQEVLRVLVAHCLIKSAAYPPQDELDDALNSLVTSPKQTLTQLASLDSEAAAILSNNFSGYATIRTFYDLRDEEINLKSGDKPAHRPMARRRVAANALMVVIASAASSIRGGLYDPEIETVVQVDVLLPLLGEALIFVNQPKRTLNLRHLYDLLSAVEDIDTAPSMIRTQCEEVLSTTLIAAHDPSSQQLPNPHHLLQKSTSNMTTASSQYSLIGSTEFGSADGQSTDGSAVLVRGGQVDESKRGWDWRKGFGKNATGSDIIRVIRLGISREISRAYAEGEVKA